MQKHLITILLFVLGAFGSAIAQQVVKATNVNIVSTPGTKIVINGGITFTGSTNFKDSGEVYLRTNTLGGQENWTDSTAGGVYDVLSNGKVFFESDSFQYIYGNTRFYNLRSFSDSGVVLNTNSEVRNILNLDKRLLHTLPTTKMYVSNPALNAIQSSNSFTTSWVRGRLEREANIAGTGTDGNDYTFHVGNDTLYAPVKLSKFNTNNVRYMAEYFYATPPNNLNVFSPPIDHISRVEYWDISSNLATGNDDDAKVWLSWRGRSYVSGTAAIRDSLLVAQYINRPPDIWDIPTGWVTGNALGADSLSGYVRSNGFYSIFLASTDYDHFTLGTYSKFNALPVKILYFTAIGDGNKVRLNWDVKDEQEVSKYEVEKSINGTSYSRIDVINSLQKAAWLYTDYDFNPVEGWNYYRLRIIDIRGKVTYSDIRKVKFSKGLEQVKLFPVPAVDILTVQLPSSYVITSTLQLYSVDGKFISTLKPSVNNVKLNVQPLAKGTYVIRIVKANGQSESYPFIKQ
jgi:Secretion system C-terminal sorting domain